ncbi:hypothetical protein L1D19_19540 [Vibrio natriegens]|uniref:hypothetical protein n=1 Tax=Vibrio natriegens TaxID=691 RepID=UPI001EFC5E15|nr:hypothetical protein [Vibrio natriegens]MCG9702271.1 hypothetical protein [Vibrio natriegens]
MKVRFVMSHKLTLAISAFLFCGQMHAEPVLYADYLEALNAPISTEVQEYARQGMPTERVMNLVFRQSQKTDDETAAILLENATMLMAHPDYQRYLPMLRQVRIQALFVSGQLAQGIEDIQALPQQEQPPYCLLLAAAYLQLGQFEQAQRVFNTMTEAVFERDRERSLYLAQDMVVNYGISSDTLDLPGDGDEALTQNLADYYDDSGVFDRAYAQRKRLLDWMPKTLEQQPHRQTLTAYAHEHDLVPEEVAMMEAYLLSAVQDGILIGDIEIVNDYTDKQVVYYADPRNKHHREPEQIEPLLAAQRLAGQSSNVSQQAYLEHRLFLYQKTRPAFYYTDVIELAQLTEQSSLLTEAYQSTLPDATRQALLEGYFALPSPESDSNALFMAKEYVPFIEQCDADMPALIRALKGHELAQASDIEQAQVCYDGLTLTTLPIDAEMLSGLQQEQTRVSYAYLKSVGDEEQALMIAQGSSDETLRFDAALFAVESQPLTPERVADLLALQTSLALTPEQNAQFEDTIATSLRDTDELDTLMTVLKRSPEAHAMELASLAMTQDEAPASVDYLLMRMAQTEPLAAYDEVKAIRYLDGQYAQLDAQTQQRVAHLPQPSVQTMLTYHQIETQLAQAFPETDAPVTEAVSASLNEYNRLKTLLSPVPAEPNYTAQLWLLSELDRQFAEHLSALTEQADDNVAQVLMTQVTQLSQQSEQSLRQLLSLKVEGVTDLRVLAAAMRLKEESNE